MKRLSKKLIALVMAMTMVLAMGVTSFAAENDSDPITVSVAIKRTGVNGTDIKSAQTVTLDSGSTALDALRALYPNDTVTSQQEMISINGTPTATTCYYQGDLKWYMSPYGNYIPCVKVSGHSSSNKYFGNNGTASYDTIASQNDYFMLENLKYTEVEIMGVEEDSTWNNTVHTTNYLSEKDYNDNSGWMLKINGDSPYYGVDTVLQGNETIVLDFSMMMGLDIGLDGYVQKSNGEWTFVEAWN